MACRKASAGLGPSFVPYLGKLQLQTQQDNLVQATAPWNGKGPAVLTLSAKPAAPAVSRPPAVKQPCCWQVLLAACQLCKQPSHPRALRACLRCCWLHAWRLHANLAGAAFSQGNSQAFPISPRLACAGAGCVPRACMLPTRGESTVVKPEAARAVDLASTSLRLGRSQCRCVAVCITHHMLWLGQGTSNSSMCVCETEHLLQHGCQRNASGTGSALAATCCPAAGLPGLQQGRHAPVSVGTSCESHAPCDLAAAAAGTAPGSC